MHGYYKGGENDNRWFRDVVLETPVAETRDSETNIMNEVMSICPLEATTINQTLSYFGYILSKNECMEKSVMSGISGGKRTRGEERQCMR